MDGRRAVELLRRHGPAVLVCAAVGGVAGVVPALDDAPLWEARAAVLLGPRETRTADASIAGVRTAALLMPTYASLTLAREGQEKIAEDLRSRGQASAIRDSAVSIARRPETLVLDVVALNPRSEDAEAIADATSRVLLRTIQAVDEERGAPLVATVVDDAAGSAHRPGRDLGGHALRGLATGLVIGTGVGAWRERRDRQVEVVAAAQPKTEE